MIAQACAETVRLSDLAAPEAGLRLMRRLAETHPDLDRRGRAAFLLNGLGYFIAKALAAHDLEVVPLLLLAALGARRLALLDLDPQSARGLGLGTRGGLVLPVLLAAALTAAAVATVGGVGFVGLIASHLARRLVGTGPGAGLLATALIGALMVLGADLAVRALFAPVEIPTGAVIALVGAPYFLYLLARRSGAHG